MLRRRPQLRLGRQKIKRTVAGSDARRPYAARATRYNCHRTDRNIHPAPRQLIVLTICNL